MFPSEFCENFKNNYFAKNVWTAVPFVRWPNFHSQKFKFNATKFPPNITPAQSCSAKCRSQNLNFSYQFVHFQIPLMFENRFWLITELLNLQSKIASDFWMISNILYRWKGFSGDFLVQIASSFCKLFVFSRHEFWLIFFISTISWLGSGFNFNVLFYNCLSQ